MIKTAEFVSPRHPDKMCDIIADTLLDKYLENDPDSRVALEIMGGHEMINISGEVTSKYKMHPEIIANTIKEVTGKNNLTYELFITEQSPDIAKGVDIGGAGDQGIMIGYATSETKSMVPLEYELARQLCFAVFQKYPFDGKTQVTIDEEKIKTVVVSFQNTKNEELLDFVKKNIIADEYLINPAGEWTQGGFDADTGLSGRKLIIDNYGPEINIGGGSFSGKDWTKVDRSGAYMARRIAVDYLQKFKCRNVKVKLAYAIGKENPVMTVALMDNHKEMKVDEYDLSPKGIYNFLNLKEIKFAETAKWGHFGRNFSWK